MCISPKCDLHKRLNLMIWPTRRLKTEFTSRKIDFSAQYHGFVWDDCLRLLVQWEIHRGNHRECVFLTVRKMRDWQSETSESTRVHCFYTSNIFWWNSDDSTSPTSSCTKTVSQQLPKASPFQFGELWEFQPAFSKETDVMGHDIWWCKYMYINIVNHIEPLLLLFNHTVTYHFNTRPNMSMFRIYIITSSKLHEIVSNCITLVCLSSKSPKNLSSS